MNVSLNVSKNQEIILREDVWRRGHGGPHFGWYIYKKSSIFPRFMYDALVTKYFRAHQRLSESFRVEQ